MSGPYMVSGRVSAMDSRWDSGPVSRSPSLSATDEASAGASSPFCGVGEAQVDVWAPPSVPSSGSAACCFLRRFRSLDATG